MEIKHPKRPTLFGLWPWYAHKLIFSKSKQPSLVLASDPSTVGIYTWSLPLEQDIKLP